MDDRREPTTEAVRPVPLGGLSISDERLKVVLPQWEATRRSIRAMDSIELGETEPATVYVWAEERS